LQSAPPADQQVNLQIVVSKYQGDKKISIPFSFLGGSTRTLSEVRLGQEVSSTTVVQSDGTTRTVRQQFGAQMSYLVTPDDAGTFKIALTLALRIPTTAGQYANFSYANTVTVRDGQTTQYNGTDNTGQAVTVDVTFTVGK
jgi:hypothetical protein